ncbi:MAG: DUF4935 domain-containing protein [Nanoarchaeota archaeon]|nr:DUF4935 domain-containing protein [Nanoarchaeota archaeon]
MTKNVFIDANIYLEIYSSLSQGDIPFNKLKEKIEENVVKVYLPQQVIDEVNKNKEDEFLHKKLKKLKNWSDKTLKDCPPKILSSESFELIKEGLEKEIEKIKSEAYKEDLIPDKLLKEIWDKSDKIEITEEILKKAYHRCFIKGNPPRKENSEKACGDAINWECLLESVSQNQDIYIISKDGDFSSKIDERKISLFLKNEWADKKKTRVVLYLTLSEFLKEECGESEITDEQIKKEESTLLKPEPSEVFLRNPPPQSGWGWTPPPSWITSTSGVPIAGTQPVSLFPDALSSDGSVDIINSIVCQNCRKIFYLQDPQWISISSLEKKCPYCEHHNY